MPLRVGMGIHAGPLLLGRIGYGETVDMTVVGNGRGRQGGAARQHARNAGLTRRHRQRPVTLRKAGRASSAVATSQMPSETGVLSCEPRMRS